MVEPVVVIGDIVGATLALHATERTLSGIPEVYVVESHILRIAFNIDRSVTFCLIAVTTYLSIENVNIVSPTM